MKRCAYCQAPCTAIWSPAENKAERFAACDRLHAIYYLHMGLILPAWRVP